MGFPKTLLLIFVFAFLLRAFPLAIDSMTGPDPWFHARMAESIVEEQAVPTYDELSMQGRFYSYAPLFHSIIAVFSIASGISVIKLTPIFPAIYGAFAALLAFAFAKRAFKSDSIALFAALAISLMPLHLMRTASYARPDSLALLIVPTIVFLIYIRQFKPAYLLTAGLALLHPLSTMYLFLFLVAWMVTARVKRIDFEFRKILLLILIGTLVWLIWLYTLPYSPMEYVSAISLDSAENAKPLLLSIFTFFTFSWLFLLVGIAKIKPREHMFLVAWFVFSLLYAAFSLRLAIFLSVPVAIIASFGFGFVFEKTRKFAPVVFALLFVLSTVVIYSEANSTGWFTPIPEREALAWLQNTPEDSVIASRWDVGHPLTYLSKRQIVMDGYFEFAPELDERNKSMSVIPLTADCNRLKSEQEKWGFDYYYLNRNSISSIAFQTGLLEADCNFISTVYSSDFARILEFA